ncbi:proteoglycan 4-like isoform X2 [Asterias rubens]|uniref:proteoglycan 4-like isoform X2 n=1 Tax=Asterias rubens TaxID=7604 RepID=UPI001455A2D8|nr:proteoglycan 4-like isoform X2 [Asterias rubens]
MAQFSGLSGGGVALPIGVLIIVLTMAYSPVTGQVSTTYGTSWPTTLETYTISTTETYSCAEACDGCVGPGENECIKCHEDYTFSCRQCDDDDLDPGDTNCTCVGECLKLPLIAILIGGIVGGVALFVLVLVIIVCCCRRRGPPKPVKRDFRLSTVTTQPATDSDIYGNVDNHGNVIRYNMPNEMEMSPAPNSPTPTGGDFGDIYENNIIPSLPIKPLPKAISPARQDQDFGDVYENTQIGEVPQLGKTSHSQPRAIPTIPVRPPSPARKEHEDEDSGGMYTNELIHHTTNKELLLQKLQWGLRDIHPAPAIPRKQAPPTASQPSGSITNSPKKKALNPPLTHRVNMAFEGDSPNTDKPLPTIPAPAKISTSQSCRLPLPAAPTPGSRFNSLPINARETPPSHLVEMDDITEQPSRLPPLPPSQKPKKQTPTKPLQPSVKPPKTVPKKKKEPPKTSPKRPIDRYIDDDVRGAVEMGTRLVPDAPDHGGVYEAVESPTRKDFGENYEVCDIQSKPPSPTKDYALSYEYVDQPKQDTGSPDYGGSYEIVEAPSTQDYGEEYEAIERPSFDIRNRAPMPTPDTAASYPPPKPQTHAKPVTKRSLPSQHNNSEQDNDGDDWGDEYTNVPKSRGGKTHPPQHHRQPPLPGKLHVQRNDFYDDILQGGDDGQEDDDGEAFTPGKHYKNVPARREQHKRLDNYIQLTGKSN